jgi:hypothetical protein
VWGSSFYLGWMRGMLIHDNSISPTSTHKA